MADIFVSYAREDQAKVERLTRVLEREGFSLWWDQYLFAGDDYQTLIEKALRESKAVLVCWSRHSSASDWVRSEAEDARVNGKLIGVSLDGEKAPKPFDTYQIEVLNGWWNSPEATPIVRLNEALRAKVEGRAPRPVKTSRRWITRGALAATAIVALAVAGWFSGVLQPIFLRQDIKSVQEDVASVKAQVELLQDEILSGIISKAVANDIYLSADAEEQIAASVSRILKSTDIRKTDAQLALKAGNFEQAAAELIELADDRSTTASVATDDAVETYFEAATILYATDTFASIEAYEKGLALAPTDIQILNQLGHLYRRTGDYDAAARNYRRMIDVATDDEDGAYWRAAAASNLGNIHLTRGELEKAEALYARAAEEQRALGNKEEEAIATGNLGVAAVERGDLDRAEAAFNQALEIQKELDLPARIARQYRNLGAVMQYRGDADASDEFFHKALRIHEERGDDYGAAYQHAGLGVNAISRGDYETAFDYLNRALEAHRRLGFREGVAYDLTYLARLSVKQNKYDDAQTFLEEARAIHDDVEWPEGEVMTLNGFGDLALARGDVTAAAAYIDDALSAARASGLPVSTSASLLRKAKVRLSQGDESGACAAITESVALHGAVRNDDAMEARALKDQLSCAAD